MNRVGIGRKKGWLALEHCAARREMIIQLRSIYYISDIPILAELRPSVLII